MKPIEIKIIETIKEIRVQVNGKIHSLSNILSASDREGKQTMMKVRAFDLWLDYSRKGNSVTIDWFNNF